MNTQEMTSHQLRQLVDSVMHYVTPDIRRKVMAEVPVAYNAYVGNEVVRTFTRHGEPV